MKLFIFDTETTGTRRAHPDLPLEQCHDIIQIAYLIVIDGSIRLERNYICAPFHVDNIDPKALEVNGHTFEELLYYPGPRVMYARIIADMGLFVNKYDKADKFTPLAYNGQFDMDMLRIFFLKNQDNYFGSWFDGCLLDPLPVVRMLDRAGLIAPMENHRLATVAKMLDVQEGVAHDALSDVRMLYSIYKELIADYLTSPQRRRDICGQCMGLGDESQYKGE